MIQVEHQKTLGAKRINVNASELATKGADQAKSQAKTEQEGANAASVASKQKAANAAISGGAQIAS